MVICARKCQANTSLDVIRLCLHCARELAGKMPGKYMGIRRLLKIYDVLIDR